MASALKNEHVFLPYLEASLITPIATIFDMLWETKLAERARGCNKFTNILNDWSKDFCLTSIKLSHVPNRKPTPA